MRFNLTILGSNSALPTLRRNPSAQILNHNEEFFMIDCGEGTQVQLLRYKIKPTKINHIFISHLHGDHYFGLVGLLSSFHLQSRTKTLHIYAPKELEQIVRLQLNASGSELSYSIEFHYTQDKKKELIYDSENFKVYSFPLKHRIPTTGFLFESIPTVFNLNIEVINEHNIPVEFYKPIKAGEDYNNESVSIKNSDLILPLKPIRKYAYCSDTAYNEDILSIIQDSNLLYHESTFDKNNAEKAEKTKHSTTTQAATIALKANAKQLILGHFSVRYNDLKVLRKEAAEIFTNTHIAKEGKVFEID